MHWRRRHELGGIPTSGGIKIGLDVLGGDIARGQDSILASPYEGPPSPVIASVWGKQLELEDASNPDLERIIGAYRQGSQTPGAVVFARHALAAL